MPGEALADLRVLKTYTATIAEFIGTLLLVLIGCGSTEYTTNALHISIAFGLTVGTIVWAICRVSGGHINPAVTLGFLVTRKISFVMALLYIAAQVTGAIVGAAILKTLTPHEAPHIGICCTPVLKNDVSVIQGFGIEFFITFMFVFVIFATVDENRKDNGGSGPLSIGLALTVGHLWASALTGSAMNPARALGPAVVSGSYENHWIYWVGPILGGIVGALLYDTIFAVDASVKKLIICYDNSDDSECDHMKTYKENECGDHMYEVGEIANEKTTITSHTRRK